MPYQDMLIKLYEQHNSPMRTTSVYEIRKPIACEKHKLITWVEDNFSPCWASEFDTALSNRPISCFIALHKTSILGFACYDASALGFFGPLGVIQSSRKKGIGKALTKACLMEMRLKGYGYAIVGMTESQEFYKKVAGAFEIPDSSPGIYYSNICFKLKQR